MDDVQRPMIELPDEEDLTQIAHQVLNGQFGSDGEGELDLPDLTGEDPPDQGSASLRRQRTPVRGHLAYLNVPLSMALYMGFRMFDEQATHKDAQWRNIPEADRILIWLEGMMGRDGLADEDRPPDEKVYWPGGLFQGLTFKKLIVDTHMRGYDEQLAKQNRIRRDLQRKRLQDKLGADWPEEAIDDLLLPDGGDND